MKKNFVRSDDVKHITSYLKKHDSSATSIAADLGLSKQAVSIWIKKGNAPFWSLAALEGLSSRYEDKRKVGYLVICRPKDMAQKLALSSFTSAMGIITSTIKDE